MKPTSPFPWSTEGAYVLDADGNIVVWAGGPKAAARIVRSVSELQARPASFQAGAEVKNCQLCADGWPRHKRYDGKYFHSLPEPAPDFICEKQD